MISISANTKTGEYEIKSIFDKELNMNPDEENAFNIICSFLPTELLEYIHIERKSQSYISMLYGENDFLRLKYSDKAKWISLRIPKDIANSNIDNPLFDAQKNKNQFHWRGNLKSLDDLNLFKSYIIASCIPQ